MHRPYSVGSAIDNAQRCSLSTRPVSQYNNCSKVATLMRLLRPLFFQDHAAFVEACPHCRALSVPPAESQLCKTVSLTGYAFNNGLSGDSVSSPL